MPAQIVFLSLFLGLVSDVQRIDLQVAGPVKSVRIVLGGRELIHLRHPPWSAAVDFGREITPAELVAIGYDDRGTEIARASQIINLPRARAEFEFVLHSDAVELRWRHLANAVPKRASITMDGKALKVDGKFRSGLPKLDPLRPHVLAAEMRFEDGFVARRELVIEGLRSDSVGTQLTPVLVTETAQPPPALEECFSADGVPLRTAAVEKPRALVVVVQDPDSSEAVKILDPSLRARILEGRHAAALKVEGNERIQWPIAQRFSDGQSTAALFENSGDIEASKGGMLWLLSQSLRDRSRFAERRQFADAVAVAAVNALEGGRRRAVVLVLGSQKDASRYDPATVRRYLAAVGVPLFVWSLTGDGGAWGAAEDISTVAKLAEAAKRLHAALESQRVAWVAVDPLTALRVEAKPDCGLAPVARAAP